MKRYAPDWVQAVTRFSGLLLMGWALWEVSKNPLDWTLIRALVVGGPFAVGAALWSDAAVETVVRTVQQLREE